jgi:AraC-like DNA-binding protein
MSEDHFFKHPRLPFVECRHSTNSGRHYKPHMHKSFCVGAIDRGEVVYEVDGELLKLRPGSLALINPEIRHSCNPAESSERSYYMLFLDLEWCLQVQQSLWRLDAFSPVTTVLLEDPSIYQKYITTVETLMAVGDLLEKEEKLVGLVAGIFKQACEPGAAIVEPSLQIEALKRHLSTDLESDLSMSQIAQRLRANPHTLLRQFKAATGLTPHAYRLNCRLELARKLLQEGVAVSQVALACGFFDQSHFHRHFKAVTTVTPRAYQINFIQ